MRWVDIDDHLNKMLQERKVGLGGISFNLTILSDYFIISLNGHICVSERKTYF